MLEGKQTSVKYAGFFTRLAVFILDLVILTFLLRIIILFFSLSNSPLYLLLFAWFYWTFPISRWKTTPAGKILGIQILGPDLQTLSFWRASLRFFISFLPFFLYLLWRGVQHSQLLPPPVTVQMLPQLLYLLPPLIIFFTPRRQMIHDLIVGSVVVELRSRSLIQDIKEKKFFPILQKLLRFGVLILFLLSLIYPLFYVFIFYRLYQYREQTYNASFHRHYKVDDHNDTTLRFYRKELERASRDFVNSKGMYPLFEADVKRDLALNCIEYVLRHDHNVSNWIEEADRFRKSARNRYADTEEKIKRVKTNESYLSRHFYDYDFNEVNHIEEQIVDPFDDNVSLCRRHTPVDTMYRQFIYLYIANREQELQRDIMEEKKAPSRGFLNKDFYRKEIDLTKAWLQILYKKFPDYQTYKIEQQRLAIQREKRRRQKEKEEKLREQRAAIWNAAIKGSLYPAGYFKDADLNIRNAEGLTPLMLAAKHKNDSVIYRWAEEGAKGDLNATDPRGKTVWDYLPIPQNADDEIYRKRVYGALRFFEVSQILGHKAEIVQSSYQNDTDLLQITIRGASCKAFALPPRTRCRTEEPPPKDPIVDAIRRRDFQTFQRLLPSVKDPARLNLLLHASIQYHNHQALERLLASGIDANKPYRKISPLMRAVYRGDAASVRMLLRHGADPNVLGPNDLYTPLSWAASVKNIALVKLLLDNGADVNYQRDKSETALTVATKGCENFSLVKLLLDYGADPHRIDRYGYDTLSGLRRHCRHPKNYQRMKRLIESYAKASQKN
ncbi:ankyrin repeat domain-containing protein [Nitratifractor sp.]